MHCFLIKKNKITWIYISRCIKTGFPICPNFENLNNFFFEKGNRVVSRKHLQLFSQFTTLSFLIGFGYGNVIYVCIIML